jgi:hypothetical protein
VVIEARNDAACDCASRPARLPVAAEHAALVDELAASSFAAKYAFDCYCEIPQLTGAAAEACASAVSEPVYSGGSQVDGFCYLDGTTSAYEALLACPPDQRHMLRLVGAGAPQPVEGVTAAGTAMFCSQKLCP